MNKDLIKKVSIPSFESFRYAQLFEILEYKRQDNINYVWKTKPTPYYLEVSTKLTGCIVIIDNKDYILASCPLNIPFVINDKGINIITLDVCIDKYDIKESLN